MDGTLMQRPDQPAMLAALERLVATESPSSDKTRCDACADEIAKLFQQRLGVAAIRHRRPDAGDHLEIRIGEGTGPVVLLCHHDTVWPEGTLGRLPFRVQGDRVTGPGSYDMKAGIVEAAFALEELAGQVLALEGLAGPALGTTMNIGVVGGGTRPNVVAARARAEIDVRFARASEAERVVAAIQGLQPNLEGARLRIRGGIDRPPMERSPGVVRLAQLAQRLATDVGFALSEMSTGGASDGNFTAAMGVPTLDGLGPDGGGAHADSEHLLVESWLQRTQLLRLLIEAL